MATLFEALELRQAYTPVHAKNLGLKFRRAPREWLRINQTLQDFGIRPDVLFMHGRERVDYFYDDAAKAPYVSLSIADKARYEQEMLSYVPPPDDGKKKRKKKDPNAPKGARTPWACFIAARKDDAECTRPSPRPAAVPCACG